MEPTLINLGDVAINTDTLFEHTITNPRGDKQQVNIRFSCGACTFPEDIPNELGPNEAKPFKFRFLPTALGPVIKSIFIIIGNIEITILFKANVI